MSEAVSRSPRHVPGDLAVVVKVPSPPELSLVKSATFNYWTLNFLAWVPPANS